MALSNVVLAQAGGGVLQCEDGLGDHFHEDLKGSLLNV